MPIPQYFLILFPLRNFVSSSPTASAVQPQPDQIPAAVSLLESTHIPP